MYLEIDEGYFEHPKTLDLCARLVDSKASVYPLRLWKWACRSARSGKLGKVSAFAVEKAVDYEPMDGRCFESMCEVRFIDREDDGTCEIHDWMLHTGGAIKRMDDKASENRKRREEGKKRFDAAKNENQGDSVPESYRNRTSINPSQTRPVQTSPDKTSQERGNPPARDPSAATTEHDQEDSARKTISGFDLCHMFGRLRRKILSLQCPPGAETPPDANGKASRFAEQHSEVKGAEFEATMTVFLGHLKAGDKGWDADPNNASLSFGAWRDRFGDLRAEIAADKIPKPSGAPVARKDGKPGMQARY
jgi:hypothetical protein